MLLKFLLNCLNKGMAVFYGCIGTQCIWNVSKILSVSGQMSEF